MSRWQVVLPVAVSAAILIIVVIVIIFRSCNNFSKQGTRVREATITMEGQRSKRVSKIERSTRANYNLFRRVPYTKPLFSWADHPSLITDAIENGWSRFAFTNCSSPPSQVEATWELREGSIDFMQKIWMNSGLKKSSLNSSFSMAANSVVRTCLPLPGPRLGNSPSFPQVAYFEITILAVSYSDKHKGKAEGEKTKLIGNSDSIHQDPRKSGNDSSGELKQGERVDLIMSLGLTSCSVVPLKLPGSYRGSIGFNSDGSVNLDGIRLAYGSEKGDWGQEEKVIGCGFDPRDKKVFFTVNSELVHVAHCKSDEFGGPLYPVLAANVEIAVLVNLGQSGFLYEPANAMRTPNPCFMGPLGGSPAALGYEDSGELFSMGRIDASWRNICAPHSGSNSDIYSWHGNDNDNSCHSRSKVNGDGDESERDLFEIVLDVKGKSPYV